MASQLDLLERLRAEAGRDPAAGRWTVRRTADDVGASVTVRTFEDGTFRVSSFDHTSVTQACVAPDGG